MHFFFINLKYKPNLRHEGYQKYFDILWDGADYSDLSNAVTKVHLIY
jgi:hypothetical protein